MKTYNKQGLLRGARGLLLLAAISISILALFPIQFGRAVEIQEIEYDGNWDFITDPRDVINNGDGSAGNPYIIDLTGYSIAPDGTHGIHILNTNVHFIIRNGFINPIERHDYWRWGIVFTNVTNGRIEDTLMYAYQYNPFLVAAGGIQLDHCFNCTVSGTQLKYVLPSKRGYLGYGIYLIHTNYSTIGPDNLIQAHWSVILDNSHHNNISHNDLTGKSISTHYQTYGSYDYLGSMWIGIDLRAGSSHNLMDGNVMTNFVNVGINLAAESRFNTIIKNELVRDPSYTAYGDAHGEPFMQVDLPNYLHRINTPENKTYMGPVAPAPGHYPASDRFETLADGIMPTSLWSTSGLGTGQIVSQKTDRNGNNHKKVLYCSSNDGAAGFSTLRVLNGGNTRSGTIEFWVAPVDTYAGSIKFSLLNNASAAIAQISLSMGTISYLNGTGVQASTMTYIDNTWYRISLDFSGDGSYAGLGTNQYRFRIHNSDGNRILFTSPVASYNATGVAHIFRTNVRGNTTNYCTSFVDAIGYTWQDDYDLGDNSKEGMLLSFDRQENSFVWDRMDYKVDDGSWVMFYDQGTTWHNAASAVIIPIPENDGGHKIQLNCWDSTRSKYFPSAEVHFTTLFNSYLYIVNQTENGIIYAAENNFVSSGVVMLNPALDFKVNVSCYTYFVNQSNKTWTNASFFYKINGNPEEPEGWSDPNPMGYDNGTMTGHFSIGNGNYSDFDNVYYYLQFEQYTDASHYLDSFFWTSDGVIKYNLAGAREAAFRKKVSPIPYQLTLDYSVFYQAQVPITLDNESGGTITTYPMKPMAYENVSVNFYNMTASHVNYSVECDEEAYLNHVMYLATGNITKTANPQFLLADGIICPFILPISHTYAINDEITLPLIFFDNKTDPGRKLTFTGEVINLTYARDENFPSAYRKVMVFSYVSATTVATVFFDYYTRVMVYLDYKDTSVLNAAERVVFALYENNQSYQVNQKIIVAPEVQDYGTILMNDTLLGILYDPPGDNSYSQITSGTTFTLSLAIEKKFDAGFFFEAEALAGAFGATAGVGVEFGFSVSTTDGTEAQMAITVEKTMTSSTNTEDALLIGPGRGDLYYGAAVVVEWQLIANVYYLANGTLGENMTTLDDINVWKNGSHMAYSPGIDASFSALGAYLDSYNLSHLHDENPFYDNVISAAESQYLVRNGEPLLWTPNYATEISISQTSTYTRTRSVSMEIDLSVYTAWDVEADYKVATVKSNGKVGAEFTWSMSMTGTTSTEVNKQIMAHLEDDDGTPIGEHDQFLMDTYIDKRFGTMGFIYYPQSTYTSYPHEFGTKDRRSPVESELLSLGEWLHGNTTLHALAIDDETGVSLVEFYWSNIPYFVDGVATRIGYQTSATSANTYDCIWDTTIIPTSYGGDVYLFAVTSDNAGFNYSNTKVSVPYAVKIDNAAPTRCSLIAYTPYEKVIPLYASVLDRESGIDYVEYWVGDPSNPGSRLLGRSDDPSRGYEFLWATDPFGDDDGSKIVYAVAYDKAGNRLASQPFEIKVENVKALTAEAEAAIVAGATGGGAGIAGWLLSRAIDGVIKTAKLKKKGSRS